MWKTTLKHQNELNHDRVEEMTHDFGSGVRVITNFPKKTTCLMHGEIVVGEHDLIEDTENYTQYLNNVNSEVNPQK